MDMPLGDPTNPNKRKWMNRVYNKDMILYSNQDMSTSEQNIYQSLFDEITIKNKLEKAEDLMMLDNALFDYLRIKRLQRMILKEGDFIVYKLRSGRVVKKAHEASYLLTAIETQFRNTMKELLLTRKEVVKKKIGMDSKDFASFLSDGAISIGPKDE